MSDLLSDDEIQELLKKNPEWEIEGDKICRTVEFEDYNEAIDFVNDVAEVADEAQHHPDLHITYGKVTIYLTTHDEGGVTEADIEVARRVDNLID